MRGDIKIMNSIGAHARITAHCIIKMTPKLFDRLLLYYSSIFTARAYSIKTEIYIFTHK